ncbi:glycosyltransferase family 39 protein [Butyrivibrio proteoclasticus]|uniref:glycosyltransferase family 39 protein n=1 Tax=Butyrivibrio proteoclasticus TaxID=43305 RepID=UPI000479A419|nr:glycosyltransferase family 39 protein [Butyrivibrio proteoclasticus]
MKARNIFNLIIVFCLALASFLVLATSVVTTIYYDMHYDVDWPQYTRENIPLLLLFTAAVFVVFVLLYKRNLLTTKADGYKLLSYGFVIAYCLMLILVITPLPVNDSKTLDNCINEFMSGNYSALTEKGGYLFFFPFQLGYVAFGQIMTSIFGAGNYLAWDLLQLISILVTVAFLYKITWELFERKAICSIMALMSLGMLFFYNYVTYIYGDILSMGPQTLALYLTLMYIKRDRRDYMIGAALSISLAVMLKTNCQIALIAMCMMILFSIMRPADANKTKLFQPSRLTAPTWKRALERIIIVILLVACVKLQGFAVNTYYKSVTGLSEIPSGFPKLSWVAMGLQESELEDGWYNGYHYTIYGTFNDYNSEEASALALENIKENVSSFITRPLHGGRFLLRKFLTQWADPVCISTHNLDLVSRHVDREGFQAAACEYLVFGEGSQILCWIMNVFMTVCYFCVFVYLTKVLKEKRISQEEMLLLILIFGGMVFHEFWEGTSRYTMRYYVYWLPFAARGMQIILERIIGQLAKQQKIKT